MLNRVPQLGLPRRGVFVMERLGRPVVVDTSTTVLLGPDEEYRVGHPTDGGDVGIVLAVAPALLEDVIGGVDGRVVRLGPRDHFAACLVTRALRDDEPDQLEAEDGTLQLLGSLGRRFAEPPSGASVRLGPKQRLRVEQARALLASSPTARWDLGGLGAALDCSPFHLARQFRAATGETISRYVLRLRIAIAVERLAEGESDLSLLGISAGFAHHSHFSSRFRSVFGFTPTQARDMLTKRSKLEELRAIVNGYEKG
jgi:AraC-like DNA-binding protein